MKFHTLEFDILETDLRSRLIKFALYDFHTFEIANSVVDLLL